jgi:mono/diheme cytochrome c family protein
MACGGGTENDAENETSRDPAPPDVVRETCDDNPLLAGCRPPSPPSVPTAPSRDPSSPRPPSPPRADSELELARAAAENVLRANCGQCHGPALSPAAARAGMNYIDDIDALVESGQITPLASTSSPIVRRMRDGSMPPVGSNGPRPSSREIDAVAELIDNPVFWPELAPAKSCDGQLLSFDDLYARVQRDVRTQDSDDRPFLRYLTLSNRYNAGECANALERERQSLTKLVNMLSTRARVEAPVAIDRDRLIYRIDLRDYGWDRELRVDGEEFQDGWEAIIAQSPYAVPFVGDQADDVSEDTETLVPVLNADAMLDVAALGSLYYALIGLDVERPLSIFIADQLGIDVDQNFEDGSVVRAGTTRSQISRQDRVVERHPIEVRRGTFWQSFDFDPKEAGGSIFADPFGFAAGGTEAIFSMPNGMLGFIIADADDNIVTESNLLLDTFQDDFVARTSVSCSSCHAGGFNAVVDEVRPFVLQNRFRFNRDDFEAVTDVYPDADDLARIIEADSSDFRTTLRRAGLPENGPDPVAGVYVRFNRDVGLATAAGELGVTPAELRRNLNLLDPVLAALRDLSIDRDDFTAVFEESLCIMQLVSSNQPDPARCADVLGN